MKKNIYLHIGLHKTGTSMLQKYMFQNADLLKENGYLYPYVGIVNNAHHLLAWPLNETHPRYKSLQEVYDETLTTLKHEISKSDCENIILSSEDFSKIYSPENLKRLSKSLQEFNVKVIVYVRRQDHFLQSLYSQVVKQSRYPRDISRFVQEALTKEEIWNMKPKLDIWSKYFGQDNIILRVYEKQQLTDGLLADFVQCIGLHIDVSTYASKRVNSSLSYNLLNYLTYCNTLPLTNGQHEKLVAALEEISGSHTVETRDLLSPKERILILNKCDDSNKQIAKTYFGEDREQLFYEEWPDINADWVKPGELSVNEAMEITGEMLLKLLH
jgi:hypothetical protein